MYNKHNYDEENWKSLIKEDTASQENHSSINMPAKEIFHKDSKDLLDDLFGGGGQNVFGGYGLINQAHILETNNLLGESVELFVTKLTISDIVLGNTFEYSIDYPLAINDSYGSSFLELIKKIQADEECASDELKRLSGLLINKDFDFNEEREGLVSSEERKHILPMFCQEIIGLQMYVNSTIEYSCRDKQQHFFIKDLEVRNWLGD